MPTLYLVATPIGNLEDISARALRILGEVALIAAEDTRQIGKLLTHYEITPQARPISYHDHSRQARLGEILSALEDGDVALVSDAGTPGINDPGYELVRAAWEAGHQATPVPGPSAPIAALAASGLPTDSFLYLGYLPRKRKARRDALAKVAGLPYTLIFLETPHRLLDALADMADLLGHEREMVVARELTKLYEEFVRGTIREARAHFSQHEPRGEITLIVSGYVAPEETWTERDVREAAGARLAEGLSTSQAAKEVAQESGWQKRDVYRLIVEKK